MPTVTSVGVHYSSDSGQTFSLCLESIWLQQHDCARLRYRNGGSFVQIPRLRRKKNDTCGSLLSGPGTMYRDETRRDETRRCALTSATRAVASTVSMHFHCTLHLSLTFTTQDSWAAVCLSNAMFLFFCQRTFICNVRLFHLSSRDPSLLSCRLPPECTIRLHKFLLAPTCRFPTLSPSSFFWALLGASLVLQRALVVFTSKVPSPTRTTKFWRSLTNPTPHTISSSSLPDLCHTLWVTEVVSGRQK